MSTAATFDEPETDPTPHGGDEWADLREMLAGDPPPQVVVEDDEDDEPAAVADDVLAALVERVEELSAELADERRHREELSDKLDRLALELDAVLGEALEDERERREQLEATLREVQATLAGTAPSAGDGSNRRSGRDRRSAAERERGLAPRPLRGRRSTDGDAAPGRLDEVAGSVSAWTSDDVDRLRSEK